MKKNLLFLMLFSLAAIAKPEIFQKSPASSPASGHKSINSHVGNLLLQNSQRNHQTLYDKGHVNPGESKALLDSSVQFDVNTKLFSTTYFTYDVNGNLTSRRDSYGKKECLYDNSGFLSIINYYHWNGSSYILTDKDEYSNDSIGNPLTILSYSITNSSWTNKAVVNYDSNGVLISDSIFNYSTGAQKFVFGYYDIVAYNSNGTYKSVIEYDAANIIRTTTLFDSMGNKLSFTEYDAGTGLAGGIDKSFYDAAGNPTIEKTFTVNTDTTLNSILYNYYSIHNSNAPKPVWNQAFFGQHATVRDISVVNDSIVWALGFNRDSVSISINGGSSWIAKPLPAGMAGTISALSDKKAFVIISEDSTKGIYITTDGGDNWTLQTTGFNPSSSYPDIIHFWNDSDGVAIGDAYPNENFEIYTTSNGGTQWIPVLAENMPDGMMESTFNDQRSYRIVGNAILFRVTDGRIFKSEDKGLNWTAINTPIDPGVTFTFDFKDINNGIAYHGVPGSNKVFSTTDGGMSWDTLYTFNCHSDVYYNPVAGAYFGVGKGLSYSYDNGQSWTQYIPNNISFFPASYSASGKIFIGDVYGYVHYLLPILNVSSDTINLAAAANSQKSFDFTSNIEWVGSSDQKWLSLSYTNIGDTITTTLSASENTSKTPRSATVTFSGIWVNSKAVIVTQLGAASFLNVSSDSLSVGAAANSTNSFEITSNTTWTIGIDQNWLMASADSGSNNASVTITADQNTSLTPRTATVTVSAAGASPRVINVTQDAAANSIKETLKNELSVFPNPVSSELMINNIQKNASISIYNLNGKLLISKLARSEHETMDVRELASGVYFLQVKDNKVTVTTKLVKY